MSFIKPQINKCVVGTEKRTNPDNGRGVGIWNVGVSEPSGAVVRPKWFYRKWRRKRARGTCRDEMTWKRWENGSGGRTHKELESSLTMSSMSITTHYGEELQRMVVSHQCRNTATAIHDRVYERNDAWMLDMVSWSLSEPPPTEQRLP